MPYQTTASVLAEIVAERTRQDAKWGEQNHDMQRGPNNLVLFAELAQRMRETNDDPAQRCWMTILLEEAYEAGAETDPARIRAELVQVAAVAVASIQAIDRRNPAPEQRLPVQADPICGDRNDDEVCELAPHADGDHRNDYATVSWPAAPTA